MVDMWKESNYVNHVTRIISMVFFLKNLVA